MNIRINCKSQGFFIERDDIQDAYFNEIRKFPVLKKDEEVKLFEQYLNGETKKERDEAKTKILECNQKFVVSIAKKMSTQENFLDVISEGNLGLIAALEHFELNKNCRFITYAVSWIISYIRKYQIQKSNIVVPPNALKLYNYVKRAEKNYMKKHHRTPNSDEIAEFIEKNFDFKVNNINDVELGKAISIDEKYGVIDDDTFEESDTYIIKTSKNNIQEDIDKEHKRYLAHYFLEKLNEREKFIVTKHHGIGCEEECFDTIGMQLNIGAERVRQIYKGAVKKMQRYK